MFYNKMINSGSIISLIIPRKYMFDWKKPTVQMLADGNHGMKATEHYLKDVMQKQVK